jgi:hypothetical protein
MLHNSRKSNVTPAVASGANLSAILFPHGNPLTEQRIKATSAFAQKTDILRRESNVR